VYVGKLDEEQQIKYVGFSDNQVFMDQQILQKDQGVTYDLFKEEVVEEGEEKKPPRKFIIVPEVVKEKRMHFFNIPRLGAYMCLKLEFSSYLNAHKFKNAILEKQNQQKKKIELRTAMEESELQYKKELAEAEADQHAEITAQYLKQKQDDQKFLESQI